MIGDRELQKMSGNTFVTEDWSRLFDRGSDVKVFRLRIVSGNEIETGRILVVNSGRIHKAARAGRFERFRQLPNLNCAEVIGDCNELMFLQEINNFRLSAFVVLSDGRLITPN